MSEDKYVIELNKRRPSIVLFSALLFIALSYLLPKLNFLYLSLYYTSILPFTFVVALYVTWERKFYKQHFEYIDFESDFVLFFGSSSLSFACFGILGSLLFFINYLWILKIEIEWKIVFQFGLILGLFGAAGSSVVLIPSLFRILLSTFRKKIGDSFSLHFFFLYMLVGFTISQYFALTNTFPGSILFTIIFCIATVIMTGADTFFEHIVVIIIYFFIGLILSALDYTFSINLFWHLERNIFFSYVINGAVLFSIGVFYGLAISLIDKILPKDFPY
jgi:hypothetical protein